MNPKIARELGWRLGMAKKAKGSAAGLRPSTEWGAGVTPELFEKDPTFTGATRKTPFTGSSWGDWMRGTPQRERTYQWTGEGRYEQIPTTAFDPNNIRMFRGWEGDPTGDTGRVGALHGWTPAMKNYPAYKAPGAAPVAAGTGMGSGDSTANTPVVPPKTATPATADSAAAAAEAEGKAPAAAPPVPPPAPPVLTLESAEAPATPAPTTTAKAAPQAAASQITAEEYKQLVSEGFTPPAQRPQVSDELKQRALQSGWGAPAAAGGQSSANLTSFYQMSPQQQAEYMRQHSLKFTGKTAPQYDAAQQAMLAGLGRAYQARQTNRWLQSLFGGY